VTSARFCCVSQAEGRPPPSRPPPVPLRKPCARHRLQLGSKRSRGALSSAIRPAALRSGFAPVVSPPPLHFSRRPNRRPKDKFQIGQLFALSELIGENIFHAHFQLHKNRFQFIQREVMFPMLDAEKRLMGYAHFFGKHRIGKLTTLFSQERCQLPIKIAFHNGKVAKTP